MSTPPKPSGPRRSLPKPDTTRGQRRVEPLGGSESSQPGIPSATDDAPTTPPPSTPPPQPAYGQTHNQTHNQTHGQTHGQHQPVHNQPAHNQSPTPTGPHQSVAQYTGYPNAEGPTMDTAHAAYYPAADPNAMVTAAPGSDPAWPQPLADGSTAWNSGSQWVASDNPARPIAATGPLTDAHAAPSTPTITRSRAYRFVLDADGKPVELGSGRSGKAFLGEEHWLESKTAFRRHVAIKMLQKGVSPEDAMRFQMEKELLERVQGHPNIVALHASGESDNLDFIPESVREVVENDFMIIELCDMSLEERLKGTRGGKREDLLKMPLRDRLFRVLEYVLPIASAIEYAHLECNVCHRDIKPGNILIRLPNPKLSGSSLDVRLADFNVGKVREDDQDLSVTRIQAVPGTLFFQSPEQETNMFELLVNVSHGSNEVTYFEDFYINIAQNDTFQLFNRGARYVVMGADLRKKRVYLDRPYEEKDESNVRAQILKSVDRPADIYSIGAMFYYLVSGAFGNPKTLYDAFHKFIEYDGAENKDTEAANTIDAYIEHEYSVINNLRAPRMDENNQPVVAPADRFFSYKHYLDGNGELIDKEIIKIIGKAMIRNKPDSYCQAWEISTGGISALVYDLRRLYSGFGTYMPSRPGHVILASPQREGALSRAWGSLKGAFSSGGTRRGSTTVKKSKPKKK